MMMEHGAMTMNAILPIVIDDDIRRKQCCSPSHGIRVTAFPGDKHTFETTSFGRIRVVGDGDGGASDRLSQQLTSSHV